MEKLYIENFSNTEFVYEEDIYAYLLELKILLEKYNSNLETNVKYDKIDSYALMREWQLHMKELCIELFNSFAQGNFLSAMAMTRTLMECFVFVKIMKKEDGQELIREWFLCNVIHKVMNDDDECAMNIRCTIREFCNLNKLDYDKKWEYYTKEKKSNNAWLIEKLGNKAINFGTLCQYIDEDIIYKDYKRACEFVHGQDITTKMTPFLLYENIFDVLYLMVTYILKSIQLFNIDDEMDNQILDLEGALLVLAERYLGMDLL